MIYWIDLPFHRKLLPELMKSIGAFQSTHAESLSLLNQSMVDFSRVAAAPAIIQAKLPSFMDKCIQERIDSNQQQSLNRIFDLVKFDIPLYRYDLSVSVEDLKKDLSKMKIHDFESKEDFKSIGSSSSPKIFSGSIEEIMEIERVCIFLKHLIS